MQTLSDPKSRFIALVVFVVVVFLTGGGSRGDITSLIILRPFAALSLGYAALFIRPGDLSAVRVPLAFLVGLAVIMGLQLVPLPPSIWHSLPMRSIIAENDRLAGLGEIWRPTTLSPSKTLNALASLIVPAAALAMFAMQDREGRSRVFVVLMVIALTSALFSFLQILGPNGAFLYFYRITNSGEAVGLFANRNHNALFLAGSILLIAHFGVRNLIKGKALGGQLALVCTLAMLPLTILLLGRSRAGLIAMLLAAAISALMIWSVNSSFSRRAQSAKASSTRKILVPALIAAGCAIAAIGAVLWLSPALGRFGDADEMTELRVAVFPVLTEMARTFGLTGSGFGSFEHVYRAFEPDAMLNPRYLNQAHNDWLQILIEGGVAAGLIFASLALWAVWRIRAMVAARKVGDTLYFANIIAAAGFLLLLVLGSAVDYPLRVPSLMVTAVLLLALLHPLPSDRQRG